MRADNSHHLVAAARNRHEYTRAKAVQALREIETKGGAVTFDAIARAAGVSRSWLYSQADLRAEIERLRAAGRRSPDAPIPAQQRASDASLRQRLEAANTRNHQLAEENRQLRQQLAHALGDLRAARLQTSTTPQTRASGQRILEVGGR
jgi:hypothetical protein